MILKYITKYHFEDCVNILSEKDNLGYFSIKIEWVYVNLRLWKQKLKFVFCNL